MNYINIHCRITYFHNPRLESLWQSQLELWIQSSHLLISIPLCKSRPLSDRVKYNNTNSFLQQFFNNIHRSNSLPASSASCNECVPVQLRMVKIRRFISISNQSNMSVLRLWQSQEVRRRIHAVLQFL